MNGEFAVSAPGTYEAAGARFVYTRDGGLDSVFTNGPIHQPVDIMVKICSTFLHCFILLHFLLHFFYVLYMEILLRISYLINYCSKVFTIDFDNFHFLYREFKKQ